MEKEININTLDAVAKAASAAYEMAEREGLLKKEEDWDYIEAYDNATIKVSHQAGNDKLHLTIDVSDTVVMQRFGNLDMYQ